jgi:uncharacterized phage-associated protein
MAKSIDIARHLVLLAASEDEPEYLSPLRLHKLLYYVQAWSLTNRDRPMFPEKIEAWAHGPIVVDLFQTFAKYGDKPIPPEDFLDEEIDLDDEERDFVASVWESFKVYSANSLRKMTHQEAPWLDARKGLGPADRCSNEITHEAMRAYFASPVA